MSDQAAFMMYIVLAILAVAFVVDISRYRTKKPIIKKTSPVLETYGHPRSPVQALREKLPKAPESYAWEISVDLDRSASYILTLALFNVITSEREASTTANLSRYRPHGTTWDEFYQRFERLAQKTFDTELVGPLVAWAKTETRKNTQTRDGHVEYHLETGQ